MQWIIIIGARDGGSGGLAYNVHIYKRRGRISKRSSTSNSSGISFIYGSSFEENVHVFLSFVIRFEWHWLYERERKSGSMYVLQLDYDDVVVVVLRLLFTLSLSQHSFAEWVRRTNEQTNKQQNERTYKSVLLISNDFVSQMKSHNSSDRPSVNYI